MAKMSNARGLPGGGGMLMLRFDRYITEYLAAYCSLRNEMERNETKWNETKWKSVVCEMKICSLRNDNLLSRCVYSDILNRKFPPKKPFRPENSDCAECVTFSLPRIKFNLSSGVSNRKQDLFPFYMPWRHHICIDKCHYSYRDDLPENLPKNAKSPLPVESTYSDIPFLKCILNCL